MVLHQLEIMEEDNDIIVCCKPAGIPVQSARAGQQDMESLLKNHRAARGEPPELHVVHRLDQPVAGVMVFAKNPVAAAGLAKQFREKTVDKVYHALVEGVPKPPEGRLTNYLLRDGKTNTSRVVSLDTPGAKQAVLRYRVLEQRAGIEVPGGSGESPVQSLVEVYLDTGRHHQIRVQLAHAGHPLIGDKKYNPACGEGYLPVQLCSVQLSFVHPQTGQKKEYKYPNVP